MYNNPPARGTTWMPQAKARLGVRIVLGIAGPPLTITEMPLPKYSSGSPA